jgi:hypothetical protein
MDIKTLKKDLIYAIKTLQKAGHTLYVSSEEMEYVDGKYQLYKGEFNPFQALVLIKGWQPVPEYLTYLSSLERAGVAQKVYSTYMKEMEVMRFAIPEDQAEYIAKAPKVPAIEVPLGYTEWSYLLPLLERETGIQSVDWYFLMDGFDFVAPTVKSEFYDLGVYLREKFLPADGRKEMLVPTVYEQDLIKGPVIRKFTIQSKGGTTILEVECQEIKEVLNPKHLSYKIFSPQSLWEKKPSGEIVPPIYQSHAIYDSADEAMKACERQIRGGFEFQIRKGRLTSFTEEEVLAKVSEVKTIHL